MRKGLRTASIAAVFIGAAALGLPSAASASSIYPPTDACSIDPSTMTPGGTVVFSCSEDTFGPEEQVTVTVTGENGADTTFGFVKFAISTGSYNTTSGDAGQIDGVSITLPNNASGVYNVAAVSPSSAGGISSVTIVEDGVPLAGTGGDAGVLALWAGGGLVLLAGGAIAVIAARRRRP